MYNNNYNKYMKNDLYYRENLFCYLNNIPQRTFMSIYLISFRYLKASKKYLMEKYNSSFYNNNNNNNNKLENEYQNENEIKIDKELKGPDVFIYGREICDFHTISY